MLSRRTGGQMQTNYSIVCLIPDPVLNVQTILPLMHLVVGHHDFSMIRRTNWAAAIGTTSSDNQTACAATAGARAAAPSVVDVEDAVLFLNILECWHIHGCLRISFNGSRSLELYLRSLEMRSRAPGVTWDGKLYLQSLMRRYVSSWVSVSNGGLPTRNS